MAHIRELKVGIASYTSDEEVLHVYGEFTGGGISGTNIVGTALSISGISTFGNNVRIEGSTESETTLTFKNTSVAGNVSAINFEAHALGSISTSRVVFDWFGSEYGQSHGMNYVSGRQPHWQNHWFRNGDGDVQLSIRNNGNVAIGSHTPTSKLDVSGDVKVTGVLTATTFEGVAATFTGDVSIGGTLTYEDVTNIDSVGLITARNGLDVSGFSTFSNRVEIQYLNAQLQFENASGTYRGDIQATDTYMNVNAETELRLRADEDVVINDRSTSNRRAKFKDTSVELYYNDQKKIETSGVGATVYGTLTAGAIDVDTHVNITGVITANQYYGDGSTLTNIVTAAEAGITVNDSGTLVGTAKTLNFGDNLSVSAVSAGLVTITASSSGGGVDPVIAGLIF